MIRLWTLQAFAHGAACVSYFRWRQAPFAQEQMHAGLLRPDHRPSDAWGEIETVAAELAVLGDVDAPAPRAAAAMIIDIESRYVSDIERQGAGYRYERVLFQWYSALRGLGVDIDFVPPGASLDGYRLVLAPSLAMPDDAAVEALRAASAHVVFGPRSGGKTREFTIPDRLAPGPLGEFVPLRVRSVETLRPDCSGTIDAGGTAYESGIWREYLDVAGGEIVARYEDGEAATVRHGRFTYLATLTDTAFLKALFAELCTAADLPTVDLPDTLRMRRRGQLTFAFNYSDQACAAPAAPAGAAYVIGGSKIPSFGVAVWRDG